MPNKRILILGGTGEARALADQMVALGYDVTTSLAGVTEKPALPKGNIRIGGFGGTAGLARYLTAEAFDEIIDATHPFAAQISQHAFEASMATQTPMLRLAREAWAPQSGDRWIFAKDIAEARDLLPASAKVLLTLGRKEVSLFFDRKDLSGLARMIEPPQIAVPMSFKLVLQRPPFSLEEELSLLRANNVQYLLCKNSGGARAEKLDAARNLGIPVILVQRPKKPLVPSVDSVDQALALLLGRANRTG